MTIQVTMGRRSPHVIRPTVATRLAKGNGRTVWVTVWNGGVIVRHDDLLSGHSDGAGDQSEPIATR